MFRIYVSLRHNVGCGALEGFARLHLDGCLGVRETHVGLAQRLALVLGAVRFIERACVGQRFASAHPGVGEGYSIQRHVGGVFTFRGEGRFLTGLQGHAVGAVDFLRHLETELRLDDAEVDAPMPCSAIDGDGPGIPLALFPWDKAASVGESVGGFHRIDDDDVCAVRYVVEDVLSCPI